MENNYNLEPIRYIERIAHIAPLTKIKEVFGDIEDFFTQFLTLKPIIPSIMSLSDFNSRYYKDNLNENEKGEFNQYVYLQPNKVIEYMLNNPLICKDVVNVITSNDLMKLYKKSYYFEFLNISFFCDDFAFFIFM